MIYSLTTFLVVLIATAVFFQRNKINFTAALAFTTAMLAHELFLSAETGFLYYGSAGLFDLIVIGLLSRIRPIPSLSLSLQKICIVSIGINLMGWVLWSSYCSPLLYNLSFVALYAWTAYELISKAGDRNVGNNKNGSWFDRLYPANFAWLRNLHQD